MELWELPLDFREWCEATTLRQLPQIRRRYAELRPAGMNEDDATATAWLEAADTLRPGERDHNWAMFQKKHGRTP